MARAKQIKGAREKRVQHIARLMSDLQWGPDKRVALAAEWGVTEGAMYHYAAEAHRLLGADPAQRAMLRQMLADRIMAVADRARNRESRVTGLNDFRSELEALRTYAEFLSILADGVDSNVPTRVEIKVVAEEPKPGDAGAGK